MNRIQKISIVIATLSVLVIALAMTASSVVKPNQATPIKNVLPARASSIRLPKDYTIATWIWESPTQISKEVKPTLEFAVNEDINTIYLYIDEYVDIYEMPEGNTKNEKLAEYVDSLKKFLTEAKEKGIEVHAMAGNSNYGYDSHEYIPPIIIKHIFDFNKENPDIMFSGIQFDVEFYDNKKFFDDTNEYTNSFLKLVEDSSNQVLVLNKEYQQSIKLGFVIPFWFDKENDYFKEPILPKIVTSLSKVEGSYLVIMAYRNVIDEVQDVSSNELSLAHESGIEIIIAQEVAKNSEVKITHFGKSRDDIKIFLNEIINKNKQYTSFSGVSIHDLSAFRSTL